MAQDALGLVGLWFGKRHPHELSAGMKQHPLMP
ncbi:ABC-type nitrate/sulfonate/bicarbonate transport system ATPase subunit [Bradyrhizobium sp. GM2.4]